VGPAPAVESLLDWEISGKKMTNLHGPESGFRSANEVRPEIVGAKGARRAQHGGVQAEYCLPTWCSHGVDESGAVQLTKLLSLGVEQSRNDFSRSFGLRLDKILFTNSRFLVCYSYSYLQNIGRGEIFLLLAINMQIGHIFMSSSLKNMKNSRF
jgi:hypothetical protein